MKHISAFEEQVHSWSIPGAEGQAILGDTHVPAGREPIGSLILCHGFKGYKDYGFFPMLSTQVCRRGLVVHRFNFSHSGMTRRVETFERPDLFERDTWGKQIFDLTTVARAAQQGQLPDGRRDLPGVWFGHSRGGIAVLLAAARLFDADDPLAPRRIICAAAPHESNRLEPIQRRLLLKHGFIDSPSARTGQTLRVGRGWLEEIERDPAGFDPVRAISRVRCPVLILHGDNDKTVPPASAHALAEAAGPRAQLRIIAGATHVFNAPNPMDALAAPAGITAQFAAEVCAFAAAVASNAGG